MVHRALKFVCLRGTRDLYSIASLVLRSIAVELSISYGIPEIPTVLWMNQHSRGENVNPAAFEPFLKSIPVDTFVLLYPSRVWQPGGIRPVIGENGRVGSTHGSRSQDVNAVF